jgi:hypothetical protein
MTKQEFEAFKDNASYHVEKFRRGKIDGDELVEALRVSFGDDSFVRVRKIMDSKPSERN